MRRDGMLERARILGVFDRICGALTCQRNRRKQIDEARDMRIARIELGRHNELGKKAREQTPWASL